MSALKHLIEDKHREAEQTTFNQRMVRGELTSKEYSAYLFQQYNIFCVIERHVLPHPNLSRSYNILQDIRELTPLCNLQLCSSTFEYMLHLYTLDAQEILPHVYLNYLALMFGGQLMKQKTPGEGRIYNFTNMPELLKIIRDVQQDDWAAEANIGLQHHINIFYELQNISGHGI